MASVKLIKPKKKSKYFQLTAHQRKQCPRYGCRARIYGFYARLFSTVESSEESNGAAWQNGLNKKSSKYASSLLALRGNDFVICNDYGFPINPDSYGDLVRRVGKKAGIEGLHPHMFRHTFVSILLSNPNIGIATVAAEAGHAQPSTTLSIYTQVYDRRREEIRKQMSRELYNE